MSDCLPAIEAMLQGIIIEFPTTMTFEYLGDHPSLGKMIACDHKGYPIIGGHDFSQYKGAEFQGFHVIKVGLPWVIEVPTGTPAFSRHRSTDLGITSHSAYLASYAVIVITTW